MKSKNKHMITAKPKYQNSLRITILLVQFFSL